MPDGYFSKTKQYSSSSTDQGNSFESQLALIQNARQGDVVRVYNEEMASTPIIYALTAAATPVGKTTSDGKPGQGADVRVVMSYSSYNGQPSSFVTSLEQIAAAGGKVTLFADQSDSRYSAIGVLNATFDKDFNNSQLTTQLTPQNPKNIPAEWLWAGKNLTSPQAAPNANKRLGAPVPGVRPNQGRLRLPRHHPTDSTANIALPNNI